MRGGEVRKVESILPDGRRIVLKSFDTRYFSVDGLFLTMADYVAQLKNDHPSGESKAAQVVMRFKPDPKLGYPQWFRRDVMGSSQSIGDRRRQARAGSIDVKLTGIDSRLPPMATAAIR